MKTKLIYLLAFLAIGFSSCDKTEDEKTDIDPIVVDTVITVEEANIAMAEMGDDMAGDISGIMNTEGGAAIESLASIFSSSTLFSGDEGGRNYKNFKTTAKNLYKSFIPSNKIAGRSLRASGFVFEEHTGVYDYNFILGDFERTADSDVIEINFPTEGSTTLDGQLVISDLDVIEYTYSDEWGEYTETYPTSVKAALKVEDVLQASLDLALAYNNDYVPVSGDLAVFVNPYTFEASFANTNSTNASISASLEKGTELIAAIDLDMVKAEDDDLKSVNGFIQYRTVKLQGSVSNPDYINPEPESMNEYINLSVYQNSLKMGDIEFFLESDGDDYFYEQPYLVFSDGSKKHLEEVLEPVIAALEEELDGLFGEEEGGRIRK